MFGILTVQQVQLNKMCTFNTSCISISQQRLGVYVQVFVSVTLTASVALVLVRAAERIWTAVA